MRSLRAPATETQSPQRQVIRSFSVCFMSVWVVVFVTAISASAQGVVPLERLTFDEAIRRAVENNPTVTQAAAGIIRAQAILQQVRADSLPSLEAAVTTSVIDPVPSFGGTNINPRTQVLTSAGFVAPLIAPVEWAQRNQAGDQVVVAQ